MQNQKILGANISILFKSGGGVNFVVFGVNSVI